jgi:hypothetical protein
MNTVPSLAEAALLRVRDEVHVRRVEPDEPWLLGFRLPLDEVLRGLDELVVASLHAFSVQRARVLDLLLADLAPARHHGLVVLVRGPRMNHTARAELLAESRILRIVRLLGVFFGIQVIEVAEELVEAVIRGQHVVQVAQVVRAELARRVTLLLEQRRDLDDLLRHADRRGRDTDLRKARAADALAADERRAAGRAALLAVRVREQHAFLRMRSVFGV